MFEWAKKLINKAGKAMAAATEPVALGADEKKWLEYKINRWKFSPERRSQIDGERYYKGEHKIMRRKREAIGGSGGELVELTNLPCNKIVDNQYGKIADQKRNYLLGQPVAIDSDNKTAAEAIRGVLDAKFLRTLSAVGLNCINSGLCWIFPHYDDKGEFRFKVFPAYEILPFWKDAAHTELDFAVRYYRVEKPYSTQNEEIEKVEIYRAEGIQRFVLENGKLKPDETPKEAYITLITPGTEASAEDQPVIYAGWERVPLVPFKFNAKEQTLLERCKSIQDAINETLSEFRDNMQEDSRNTILVLKNYGGENLAEFRRNLTTYGAVKVTSTDGVMGGVETLKVDVNAANYELVLKLLKKALIENCRGYDAKDDSVGGNANQMHISAMFNDIDIDANEMEAEFQASLVDLLFFVKAHLANTRKGDFEADEIRFTFNRDLMMNQTEILDGLVKAGARIPNRMLLGQVPFIDDVDEAEELLDEEDEKNQAKFTDPFTPGGGEPDGEGDVDDENAPDDKEDDPEQNPAKKAQKAK
jgi:SPP1 family phage portal protein